MGFLRDLHPQQRRRSDHFVDLFCTTVRIVLYVSVILKLITISPSQRKINFKLIIIPDKQKDSQMSLAFNLVYYSYETLVSNNYSSVWSGVRHRRNLRPLLLVLADDAPGPRFLHAWGTNSSGKPISCRNAFRKCKSVL